MSFVQVVAVLDLLQPLLLLHPPPHQHPHPQLLLQHTPHLTKHLPWTHGKMLLILESCLQSQCCLIVQRLLLQQP